jgi:signal transduction histidine kinase
LSHQIQKRKVRIHLHQPNDSAIINGYANQIQQVYLNLIVNAMDAMPEGGTIEIGLTVNTNGIELWFKDQGIGMDAETKSHIFDPFFTTKEVGKGTGLGLAVVYRILQDHGASIEVESEPGRGCSFILLFPASRDEVIEESGSMPDRQSAQPGAMGIGPPRG